MIGTTPLSRFLQSGALAGCCAVALVVLPWTATAAPLEAYGRLPSVDKVVLSPDGARIAIVVASAQDHQLQIRSTSDLKLQFVSSLGRLKLTDLEWASPEHLIIVTAKTADVMELTGPKQEWRLPAVLDVTERKVRPLLDQEQHDESDRFNRVERMNTIFGSPQPQIYKGKPVVIMSGQSFINNQGVLTMFRQGVDGSSLAQTIATGSSDTEKFVVDSTGRPVARSDYDQRSGQWTLWTRASGDSWQLAHKGIYKIDQPYLMGLGRDENSVMVLTEEEDGEHYREVSLAKAVWSEPIVSLDDFNLVSDDRKGTISYGYDADGGGYRYIFSDPADQQLWDKITTAFPGEAVQLASWSDDRKKIILQVEGQKSGAAYFLLDRTTNRAEWVADEYEEIPPDHIAEVRTISYRAADGLTIPAFLTLPRGVPAKALPLVVLVHGGPAARDYPGFDWWAQGLASMGYAVLQPQFRGSGGYSAKLLDAGQGEFGRKMQTDVSDGISFLAGQGLVDPGRVCIAGASYGGYAAMAGVTLQSGIYRCAVAVSGISDLRRHLTYVAQLTGSTNNSSRRYWLRFLGAKSPGDPVVEDLSPARHADRISVPLLLIHGTIDTVVEPAQSRVMLEAGQKAGKNVQLVTLKGEDHNMARSETRLQMLQAMTTFLRANLPVAAPPPQSASAKP
jgi:dipeptidyl aminopeptidase/acylaminoacyl peptidase